MRPKERRETGEQDLVRWRLDQTIDMDHALAKLARAIDWSFLEREFGVVYTDEPGHPPLNEVGGRLCGLLGQAATSDVTTRRWRS